MTDRELPTLPTPYCYEFREPRERYTAEQMRAYASQAVAAERERWRAALAYVMEEAEGWHDDCRGYPIEDPRMDAARALLSTGQGEAPPPPPPEPVAKIVRNTAGQISLQTPEGGPFFINQFVGKSLYVEPPVAAEREPFAWATLCDDALHSLSHTKLAAETRAEYLREANRGRGFHVEVAPLYR